MIGTLKPHQVEAIEKFWIARQSGFRRVLEVLPTGTGKTWIGLMLAKAVAEKGGRTLFLAHRKELIDQPQRALSMIWPDCKYGVVRGGKDQQHARHLVIASTMTVVRRMKHPAKKYRPFDLVIVDEAHHYVASEFRKPVEHFLEVNPNCALFGLTATPRRPDAKSLLGLFDVIGYRLSVDEAVERDLLVPYVVDRVVLPELDTSKLAIDPKTQDYDQETLAAELKRAKASVIVAEAVAAKCRGRRTIVFVVSIDQAKRTCEELKKRGVRAGWVSGDLTDTQRAKRLNALERGDLDVICNCQLLTEGFDLPALGCVVIAKLTRHQSTYVQMAGRVLRKHPAKRDGMILDVVGAHGSHGLVVATTLAGRKKGDTDLPELESSEPAKPTGEDREIKLIDSMIAAATNGVAVQTIADREMQWLEVAPGMFALGAGKSVVVLLETTEGCRVELVAAGSPPRTLTQTTVPMDLAQSLAEDYAREHGGQAIVKRGEDWRTKEPTSIQVGHAREIGVDVPPYATRGEVADLIVISQVKNAYFPRKKKVMAC